VTTAATVGVKFRMAGLELRLKRYQIIDIEQTREREKERE